jgi:hypothetical protein
LCFLGWSNHDQRLVIRGSGDVNIARQWIYFLRIAIGEDLQNGRNRVIKVWTKLYLDSLAKVADVIRARLDFVNIADVFVVCVHNLNPH